MSHIYLCFLWHMHQPFYKDLITGEYKLPWTRMHALKDYYGMVRILDEFPDVHQTFNLVPSMMVQVEEYATGTAIDPYLQTALKPAENLTEPEQDFLLRQFFHAHPPQMIYRYPRYGELYEASTAHRGVGSATRLFGTQEYRDLQVLSQLAWFDEEFQQKDPEVRDLIAKGRNYSLADQRLMGEKQRKIIGMVTPAYKHAAASGQVEISTTPYYHPILPLLCDSSIASVSHPGVTLPAEFRYPQDARRQLELAHRYITREFGAAPAGLWPSEGSVSDEVFHLASEIGFRWTATDSGVLSRTLGRNIGVDAIYRPYKWVQRDHELRVVFRDHFLSDLIGFVYSRMDAHEAAEDFLRRIRDNCRGIIASGSDALVPIILDGENAWEYYVENGRPFLRELYRRISDDPRMSAVTVSEGLARVRPEPLSHIFPGSWINANFDVWIGAEEDNHAWNHLLRARQAYDAAVNLPEERMRLAYEELLIAEGSDWCWWYGPEHDSANRVEFDQLYRSHLANVYRALGRTPPEELSRPILRVLIGEVHVPASGPITPVIDGVITSYFEWIGAGMYRVDERSGSMHGRKFLVKELYYGSDGEHFYLRVDFQSGAEEAMDSMEARITVAAGDPVRTSSAVVRFDQGRAHAAELNLAVPTDGNPTPVECAFRNVLETRISLPDLGVPAGGSMRFQISLWQGGLPMDAIPQQGWLELGTRDTGDWFG
ncbi:MAG TPA: glycoside hydrolase family 57 protein [Bryobacteraceae bacterium]|nr:glycoside hydrolase family 57 protein [Bryobacteraceae bacterium]